MTDEEKRLAAEKARLIMENLGWKMTKLEFTTEGINICFEMKEETK